MMGTAVLSLILVLTFSSCLCFKCTRPAARFWRKFVYYLKCKCCCRCQRNRSRSRNRTQQQQQTVSTRRNNEVDDDEDEEVFYERAVPMSRRNIEAYRMQTIRETSVPREQPPALPPYPLQDNDDAPPPPPPPLPGAAVDAAAVGPAGMVEVMIG